MVGGGAVLLGEGLRAPAVGGDDRGEARLAAGTRERRKHRALHERSGADDGVPDLLRHARSLGVSSREGASVGPRSVAPIRRCGGLHTPAVGGPEARSYDISGLA
jgi:hypothetical protein